MPLVVTVFKSATAYFHRDFAEFPIFVEVWTRKNEKKTFAMSIREARYLNDRLATVLAGSDVKRAAQD